MRIAHVTPFFHPHIGGVETFVGNLVRRLSMFGHEVTVVTSNHGKLPDEEVNNGVRVVRIKPLATVVATPICPKIADFIASGEFDVVHTHTPPPITDFYAMRGAEASGKPLVVSYHGDPEPHIMFGSQISSIYRRTIGNIPLSRAEKIIAHTRTYASTSQALWKYEPVIIPSAVDLDRFRPDNDGCRVRRMHGINDVTRIVLFVGRLVEQKGIEYFIRSVRLVKNDNVRFIVAGGGACESRYRALAKNLGVEEKIIFTGRVSDDDLPAYYAACDIFVLPSVSRLEGFGLVTLEALSSGKPVLVSDIPGVREVIEPGKDGLLIEPMNPRDIAEKVDILLSNREMMVELGRNARASAESKYSWDSVARKIEDVYREVAAKRQVMDDRKWNVGLRK